MKHLLLLSALLLGPLSFANPCISLEDAQAKLADKIQMSQDYRLDWVFDLESGTQEVDEFLSNLKYYAYDDAWQTSAFFSYLPDDAPQGTERVHGIVFGTVTCDGEVTITVSQFHPTSG